MIHLTHFKIIFTMVSKFYNDNFILNVILILFVSVVLICLVLYLKKIILLKICILYYRVKNSGFVFLKLGNKILVN